MNKDKFATELSKLIKKHNPVNVTEAFEMMFCLSGALMGVAHGVDSANESPYTEVQDQWSLPRSKFLAGAIYLLASSTPHVESGGMNTSTLMEGLLPLLVEKALWQGLRGDENAIAEAGADCMAEILKTACGLYMTLLYSPTRPDLNTEQLEAKGQDILDQLVNTFTKAGGNNDN